jgi:phage-related protein
VQTETLRALTMAAEGQKAENAKPLIGLGSGVLEIVLRYWTDAVRVVYATQIGDDLWVVHAFQKKFKSGVKAPGLEMAVIEARSNVYGRCSSELEK